ncbi:MAG: ABC transporter permease [Actinomycetota bacterium]|nr:ABC transporter permease [Actinomycetota bacterium]
MTRVLRLFRHERAGSAAESLLVPLASVAIALGTVAVVLALIGSDVGHVFSSMLAASFGDLHSVGTTIIKAMPRLLAALGIAIAIRANLWNIGAEGQIYVAGAAATAIVLAFPEMPWPIIPVVALLAGAASGALWGAIPGVLRAKRGISEVITSLMLVYVAIQVTRYLLEVPWAVPGATFPATEPFGAYARLPIIIPGTTLNLGVVIAALAVAAAWFIVERTRFGLDLRAVGGNERAAGVLGIKVNSVIIRTMAVSGAFAGLAGAIEILGIRGRLIEGFSPGFGFQAIAVALLGRLHPVGMVGAALLFGALDAGGAGLATSAKGVSSAIVMVAAGLSVLYVLFGQGIAEKRREKLQVRAALRGAQQQADNSQAVNS